LRKKDRIFLAGHNGLVGSAVLRQLKKLKYANIIVVSKKELNLLEQSKVFNFLKKKKIKSIIICAARVGGIQANNNFKGSFIYENLAIQNNLIHGAKINNIKNLIFLGSSCVYPRDCKQPIKEKYLLSGKLEKTNESYSIAKIAGIKLCESYNFQYKTNYKCLMPANVFGPGDNYDLDTSHFLPALISKIHNAKINKKNFVTLWGNGKALRELIYVDDLAEAIIYFLNKKTNESLINIGTNIEKTIKEYANILFKIIGVKLSIKYKNIYLTGTPRKILNLSVSKKYGWRPRTNLVRDLKSTYQFFLQTNCKK